MVAPGSKIDGPAMARSLVRWVAVHVLPLSHVDASNLVTLHLGVPWATPNNTSLTSFHVQLLTLVKADSLRVCREEVEGFSRCRDTCSLDGTVLELLTVG